ncbi:MAG: hypothetical protein AAF581_20410 [Planctomycetota bacterium]
MFDRRTALFLGVLVATTVPAAAATLNVPAQHPTIQDAILAATDGDVVEVNPGTYTESIDFLGKAIIVRGTFGAAATVISGSNTNTVVTFINGEGLDSILEGFTIRDGHAPGTGLQDGGGGIFVNNASPTIRGNIIRNNTAHWNGAGVYLVNSQSLILGNDFIDNSFTPIIADAPFGRGAGINISGGAPTVSRNTFTGNMGADEGGGLYCCDAQTATIDHNQCIGNVSGYGGGMAIDGNSLVIATNNLLAGNTAIGHSGFAGPSEGLGGGLYIAGPSSAGLSNFTIVGNSTTPGWNGPGNGGGVYADTIVALVPQLENCIVRDNVSALNPQLFGNLSLLYSNVTGTVGGTNFDTDPLFVTGPDGDFYLSHLSAGQGANSPNIDAGNPLSPLILDTTTRTDQIVDTGIIDVGFHYQALPSFAFQRGDCNFDGSTNLADAIFLLTFLFPPTVPAPPPLGCPDACDGNDDGGLNISDAVAILNALFGSPPLPLPAPVGACGGDPTSDSLTCFNFPSC